MMFNRSNNKYAVVRVLSDRRTWLKPLSIVACVAFIHLANGLFVFGAATFIPLGSFRATDVSANGSVVVGVIDTPSGQDLFRRTATETMVRTGNHSENASVSADGSIVVGTHRTPDFRIEPFRWINGVTFEPIAGFPSQPPVRLVTDFSDNGSVVVGETSSFQAFRWTEDTGIVVLGMLPGGGNDSVAIGTSANGSVVIGAATAANGRDEAFRWTAETGMVGLGIFPGALDSHAEAVSADGSVIIGDNSFLQPPPGGQNPISRSEAFRWTQLDGMVRLIDLGFPYTTTAVDVSGNGSVIVGNIGRTSPFPGDPRVGAFYWTEQTGALSFKEVLVSAGVTGLENWTLSNALAVSADGLTVVGTASLNGVTQGFIATVPEPSTIVLAIIAAAALFLLYLLRARRMLAKI